MEKLSMRAKFNGLHNQNGKNYSGDKETTCRMIIVGKRGKELAPIVEARFYMGRSRTLCFPTSIQTLCGAVAWLLEEAQLVEG